MYTKSFGGSFGWQLKINKISAAIAKYLKEIIFIHSASFPCGWNTVSNIGKKRKLQACRISKSGCTLQSDYLGLKIG
jgi:hypothetical protein